MNDVGQVKQWSLAKNSLLQASVDHVVRCTPTILPYNKIQRVSFPKGLEPGLPLAGVRCTCFFVSASERRMQIWVPAAA